MDRGNGRSLTDWGVLASWAGVILMLVFGIGTAVGGAFAVGLGYVHARVQRMEDRELADAYSRGKTDERLDAHHQAIIEQDTRLQREINQVNATTRAEVAGLDGRFQAELATVTGLHSETIVRLRQIIDELRDAQLEGVAKDARYDAEIEWLEQAISRLEARGTE